MLTFSIRPEREMFRLEVGGVPIVLRFYRDRKRALTKMAIVCDKEQVNIDRLPHIPLEELNRGT